MENYSECDIYDTNLRIPVYNAAVQEYEHNLDAVAVALLDGKKRRRSPDQMYKRRVVEGAFDVLIDRYLMDDETKFHEYFRLTPYLFSKVLEGIKDDISGIRTNWNQNPISPQQKLCLTLR